MISIRATSLILICCTVQVQAGRSCPPGFKQFENSCYWFSNIKANFAEARSYCGFLMSRLAVITSKEEDDFVSAIARNKTGRYFLGATDLGSKGVWGWERGLKMNLTYKNWNSGEPNDNSHGSGEENCLNISEDAYRWNDFPCTLKSKFVCETCVR